LIPAETNMYRGQPRAKAESLVSGRAKQEMEARQRQVAEEKKRQEKEEAEEMKRQEKERKKQLKTAGKKQ